MIPYFDVDLEMNFPTLYSFALLLISAALMGCISYTTGSLNGRFANHWAGLSIVFVWLSCDELLSVHEKWIIPLRNYFQTSGLLFYIWQLPYIILLIVLSMTCAPLWKSLAKSTKRPLFIAAVLYLSATFIFESLSGWYWSFLGEERRDALFILLTTTEETLEMSGLVLLIYSLLEHCRHEFKHITLTWDDQ